MRALSAALIRFHSVYLGWIRLNSVSFRAAQCFIPDYIPCVGEIDPFCKARAAAAPAPTTPRGTHTHACAVLCVFGACQYSLFVLFILSWFVCMPACTPADVVAR